MANLSPTKVPVPEQDPNVRNHNFEEVNLGYTPEMAVEEAGRCLQCKKPACVAGCPVNIQIPEFIAKVAEGDFQAAYEIIHQTNGLPAVSGRVCPQESQCESLCVRGKKGEPVAIGRLERFVADWYRNNVHAKPEKPASNGVKVAVVGSGPAGLTCASDLGKLGYQVSIFEAFHTAGGVLVYGIPQFRLPKEIVQHEVEGILDLGVELDLDTVIGKTITIDELFEMGYRAVFVGSGAGLPMFMDIPGETLSGVYSANEYLTRVNLMKAYREEYDTPIKKSKSVAVVGGGNVAMPPGAPSGWARSTSMWSTAAARRRCPPGWRRSTTPKRRASNSTCSTIPGASCPTARGPWRGWSASAWNWASRTSPAAAARWRSRTARSCWT